MSYDAGQKLSIKMLCQFMVRKGGSDLFLSAGSQPACRIDGKIFRIGRDELTGADCERIITAVMDGKQRAQYAERPEVNFSLGYPGVGRFRCNVFKQRGTMSMVIRHINTTIPTIEGLGLPEVFKDIVMAKRGLVMMVGATGSGKSTSLAAMIDHRNRNDAGHIITIEDPIEYLHSHQKGLVTQREVGTDTLHFRDALKSSLRQNPDAILVGEIRDQEVMEFALECSQTGHLCMATLHANSANQALERALSMFPQESHDQVRGNLAVNVSAIISQRLVRAIEGHLVPAIEILVNTPRIADLIEKWDLSSIKQAMEEGQQYGMQTFDQHLFRLCRDGVISEEEALSHADSANNLRMKLSFAGSEEEGAESAQQMAGRDSGNSLELAG
ncbi:MAG: PilT/PilU family type 4a pilus ATPase [Alphaproteobacteria bacterium]|nr:MAG: PilT/PilU family type 4a pilus ATPase [Alphaproteobacteria bacterium]